MIVEQLTERRFAPFGRSLRSVDSYWLQSTLSDSAFDWLAIDLIAIAFKRLNRLKWFEKNSSIRSNAKPKAHAFQSLVLISTHSKANSVSDLLSM